MVSSGIYWPISRAILDLLANILVHYSPFAVNTETHNNPKRYLTPGE